MSLVKREADLTVLVNPLPAKFFYILHGHGDNFLQTFTWHGLFSMFTVWHGFFSFVLTFPGLRIEDPTPSIVQGKSIYTFFKRRTRKYNFRSYVLNLVKINISFCLSKVGRHGTDLSISRAYHAPSVWLIWLWSQPCYGTLTLRTSEAGIPALRKLPCGVGSRYTGGTVCQRQASVYRLCFLMHTGTRMPES